MTNDEADQLDGIFQYLEEHDGAADPEILEALTRLSTAGKAEFVRRMDERLGFNPPLAH